jgi:diadenosine tetraphosphate (Ap4A) HIT family hydrolase
VTDCAACEATQRGDAPGGVIHRTAHWTVQHSAGPMGLGSMMVRPIRHVTAVAQLNDEETAELGPLLRQTSAIAGELVDADQVYNCLWSHSGGRPVHIHYVVQPISKAQMSEFDAFGPQLQVAMMTSGSAPDAADVDRIAAAARERFGRPATP